MGNISDVVKQKLCVQCGFCSDVCSSKAIKNEIVNGEYIPKINKNRCNNCGLCLKICTGKGLPINAMANILFEGDEIKQDSMIGRYHKCFSGYSLDHDIRFHSASGGIVSQFLIYLLEKNIIQGAVVVGFKKDNPLEAYTYIATDKKSVIDGKSSKYCVVSYEGILNQIKEKEGKFVIVGLPCHIQTIRKYLDTFPKMKEKIIGCFALYCSAYKSLLSIDYMMNRYNVDKKNISSFAYRDDGCLGYMKISDKNGKELKKIEYLKYFVPLRGFFKPKRCTLCIEHYGELADISVGDIHVDEYINDNIGVNSIVTRSENWTELFLKAQQDKYIEIKEISEDLVNRSQEYAKKHKKGNGIVNAFKFRQILGLQNPEYDVRFNGKSSTKGLIIVMLSYLMRFIGRNKQLWFIIKALDKNKV